MKTTIIITGKIDTGTAFGVCLTTGDRGFIPAAVARPFNLVINSECEAIVIENVPQKREIIPLKAIKLFGEQVAADEPDDAVTDDEVLDALSEINRSSVYDLVCHFYDEPRNSEKAEIEAILERLASAGKVAKAVISMGPLNETRYSLTPKDFAHD